MRVVRRKGEFRRNGIFIVRVVRATTVHVFEPQRGGISKWNAFYAAPMGLGPVVGRGVTIKMSSRWDWTRGSARWGSPNHRVQATPGCAGREFQRLVPGAPDPDRWIEHASTP